MGLNSVLVDRQLVIDAGRVLMLTDPKMAASLFNAVLDPVQNDSDEMIDVTHYASEAQIHLGDRASSVKAACHAFCERHGKPVGQRDNGYATFPRWVVEKVFDDRGIR